MQMIKDKRGRNSPKKDGDYRGCLYTILHEALNQRLAEIDLAPYLGTGRVDATSSHSPPFHPLSTTHLPVATATFLEHTQVTQQDLRDLSDPLLPDLSRVLYHDLPEQHHSLLVVPIPHRPALLRLIFSH